MNRGRRHQRGVTPWVAKRSNHSMQRAVRVAALDALARRDYASEDLRRKNCSRKVYDAVVVAPLLDALRARKNCSMTGATPRVSWLIHAARGQGPLRVRADFAPPRLGGGPWSRNVSTAFSPSGLCTCDRLDKKKFGAKLPSTYADQQRQVRFLGYRGFTSAQIRNGLRL